MRSYEISFMKGKMSLDWCDTPLNSTSSLLLSRHCHTREFKKMKIKKKKKKIPMRFIHVLFFIFVFFFCKTVEIYGEIWKMITTKKTMRKKNIRRKKNV